MEESESLQLLLTKFFSQINTLAGKALQTVFMEHTVIFTYFQLLTNRHQDAAPSDAALDDAAQDDAAQDDDA